MGQIEGPDFRYNVWKEYSSVKFQKVKKSKPVSRVLSPENIRDSYHLSRLILTDKLHQPTRWYRTSSP
jgi:hypothetical protein